MKKYYWLIVLVSVVMCSIMAVNLATAGPLVDAAKKVETTYGQACKDNKDLNKADKWIGEKIEAGKKWVNEKSK
jgi:hypothetical protein